MKAIMLSVLVSVSLAVMGVAITPEEGKALFKRAQAGDAQAQFELAECFAKGDGVKKDAKQARAWYEKAATQKHAQAQAALKRSSKPSLKGAVEIKDVPPEERESRGVRIVELLLATASYGSSPAPHAQKTHSAGPSKGFATHGSLPKKLKPEVMKEIVELTKGGADLDLAVDKNAKPYKVMLKDKCAYGNALYIAVENLDWELVEFLLANKAKMTGSFAVSVLYEGICSRSSLENKNYQHINNYYKVSMEKLQKLLELGMDPNATYTDSGRTLLGTAVIYNSVDAMEVLIKAGADINGIGSLEHCCYPKNKYIVAELGNTPIMCSMGARSKEAVLALLKHKPDLNVKNSQGKTVLDLKDDYIKDSKTSMDLARIQKTADEIEAILVKLGAKRAKDL